MNRAPKSPTRNPKNGRKPLKQHSGTSTSRKRISKDEKLCQLKSDLKVSREENIRLRREIERLKSLKCNNNSSGSNAPNSQNNKNKSNSINEEQRQKFREAMRALKKVTVSQEMVIKTIRTKAQQRRKELKEKDTIIEQLRQRVKSLEIAAQVLQQSSGSSDVLQQKIGELQLAYDEAIRRRNDVEEMLDEKETQLQSIQKQRNNLLAPTLHKRIGSTASGEHSDGGSVGSGSHKSVGSLSVNTAQDFDVARLKTELAQKSNKVVKLEMDLEMIRDELEELKKNQKRRNSDDDHFGGAGSHAFFPPTNNFMMEQQQQQDDWTEADETDCESEFGESFFTRNDEGLDFW